MELLAPPLFKVQRAAVYPPGTSGQAWTPPKENKQTNKSRLLPRLGAAQAPEYRYKRVLASWRARPSPRRLLPVLPSLVLEPALAGPASAGANFLIEPLSLGLGWHVPPPETFPARRTKDDRMFFYWRLERGTREPSVPPPTKTQTAS